VAYRIDLVLGAEGVLEAAEALGQFHQRVPGGIQAGLVVVRHHERPGRAGIEAELVLHGVDRGDVAGVGCIDEHPGCDQDMRRAEVAGGQVVLAGFVEDLVDVVVLVEPGSPGALLHRGPLSFRLSRD